MRHLIILFGLLLFSFGCSKTQTTPTSLKVFIGGLQGMPTGIGDGGAILYGRSKDGKLFGRMIKGNDELVEIPNGDWMFYAFFWDTSSTALDGKVYCAKSPAALTGTDVTVNLNATNANCSDPEFSNNRVYQTGSPLVNRFADFYLEDCDNLVAGSYTCGLHNQGNALSYRYVFSEFKKSPDTPFLFSPNKILSACQIVGEGTGQSAKVRAPINFPAGNGVVPFVVQVEMFYGSTDCNVNDPKGFATHTFQMGLGQNSIGSQHITSTNSCAQGASGYYNVGSSTDIEKKCEDDLGMVNAGSCTLTSFPDTIKRFMIPGNCGTAPTAATPAIKQMVMTSKDFLCQKYLNSSTQIGANPFAAGDGSRYRQFKICTEWQLNQIGEVTADLAFSNKWYKLLNDLDMNKTDFGPYAKPSCVGAAGSLVKPHHNLNPLDKVAHGACDVEKTSENNGFQGVFNGNGKTIRNARISAENISELGFTRKMYGGSRIVNLNFEGLEVRGVDLVGGVTGNVMNGGAVISNINLRDLDIEGRGSSNSTGHNIGAVVGMLQTGSSLVKVKADDVDLRGTNFVGGLVGRNYGAVTDSSFRGWIDHYHSDLYFYLGGLVGYNETGASISRSFSEGEINSYASYTAGIAGKNMGSITHSYSTMAIQSNYYNTAYLSGIAYNSGSVSNVYFAGTLLATGGSTTVDGVGGTSTSTNCYSTFATSTPNCFSYNDDEIRSGSLTFSDMSHWSYATGALPRLVFETRECTTALSLSSVAFQVVNGRGGVLNPIHLCRASQLSEVNARATGEYYRLMDDFSLSLLAGPVNNFNGTLLGNEKFLYGFNQTLSEDSIDEHIGLFKVNSGQILNLQLVHSQITNSDQSELTTGLLVGRNLGSITDVILSSVSVLGTENVGLVAGDNRGTIKDAHVDFSKVLGNAAVGSIAGVNGVGATIAISGANAEVTDNGSGSVFNEYGGIVGRNSGTVDQVEFKGRLEFNSAADFSNAMVGGIVGQNLGQVSNALVVPYTSIALRNKTSIGSVGGIIGKNMTSGDLSSSIFLGKIIFENPGYVASGGFTLHPLIGNNLATAGDVVNSYYYAHSVGSVLDNNQILSSSGSGPYTYTVDLPSQSSLQVATSPSFKADLVDVLNNNSGKVSMFPVSVLSNDVITSDFNFTVPSNIKTMKLFAYNSLLSSGELLLDDTKAINSYCQSFSGAVGREVCTSGLNIVYADDSNMDNSRGYDRMIDFYKSLMYKTPLPSDAPIWTLDNGDDYPRLIQLDD